MGNLSHTPNYAKVYANLYKVSNNLSYEGDNKDVDVSVSSQVITRWRRFSNRCIGNPDNEELG